MLEYKYLFMCTPDYIYHVYIRSYNVKVYWKVQGHSFWHEKASDRLTLNPWYIDWYPHLIIVLYVFTFIMSVTVTFW